MVTVIPPQPPRDLYQGFAEWRKFGFDFTRTIIAFQRHTESSLQRLTFVTSRLVYLFFLFQLAA